MPYTSGSVNATSSAQTALDLLAAVEAAFNAHENWDFIEQVTLSSVPYRVWRNRGSGNGANTFGQDFYVILSTTGSALQIGAAEVWDATNKKVIRPIAPYTSSRLTNVNGSHGDETAGYALNVAQAQVLASLDSLPASSTLEWFIILTKDYLSIGAKWATAQRAALVGLFEAALPDEPFPLLLHGTTIGTYSSSSVGVTRHPKIPAGETNTWNFAHSLSSWTQIGGSVLEKDRFFNNAGASRVLVRPNVTPHATYGLVRGFLKDAIWLGGDTNARVGDTLVVSSQTYRKMGDNNYPFWISEAAA